MLAHSIMMKPGQILLRLGERTIACDRLALAHRHPLALGRIGQPSRHDHLTRLSEVLDKGEMVTSALGALRIGEALPDLAGLRVAVDHDQVLHRFLRWSTGVLLPEMSKPAPQLRHPLRVRYKSAKRRRAHERRTADETMGDPPLSGREPLISVLSAAQIHPRWFRPGAPLL